MEKAVDTITDVGCVYGKSKFIIISIILLIFIIILIIFYIRNYKKSKLYNKTTNGIIKSATCNKSVDQDNLENWSCTLEVEYEIDNNKYTIKESINRYKKINDTINIFYDSTNPRTATLTNYTTS